MDKFIINSDGLALVKHFENFEPVAYYDGFPAAGFPHGTPTIGYGRTASVTIEDVENSRSCTEDEADKWLMEDLNSEAAHYIRAWVTHQLNENQFSAMTSFAYNLGCGTFKHAFVDLLNAGNFDEVAAKLPEYNKAQGIEAKGLLRRRNAERNLFLGKDWKEFKA